MKKDITRAHRFVGLAVHAETIEVVPTLIPVKANESRPIAATLNGLHVRLATSAVRANQGRLHAPRKTSKGGDSALWLVPFT